jgi:hypothetical protein
MKTSIIVMLILVIAPLVIGIPIRVILALKARDDESAINRPAPSWAKKMAFIYAFAYLAAILGVGIWVGFSLFGDQFNHPEIIMSVVIGGIVVVTTGGICYGFLRSFNKKHPKPQADYSSHEYLEWENEVSDARRKLLFRMVGSTVGAVLIIVLLFVWVVGYLL